VLLYTYGKPVYFINTLAMVDMRPGMLSSACHRDIIAYPRQCAARKHCTASIEAAGHNLSVVSDNQGHDRWIRGNRRHIHDFRRRRFSTRTAQKYGREREARNGAIPPAGHHGTLFVLARGSNGATSGVLGLVAPPRA
jgi:hypothetical protein